MAHENATSLPVTGTACVHDKVDIMHDWLAVMLVLLRPLMRKHLRKRDPELRLCREVGPFNEKGEVFSVSRLRKMFEYVGEHFVGLPRWGYNIGRSSHASSSTMLALSRDEGVCAPWLTRTFAKGRMGSSQLKGTYTQTQARHAAADPDSIDSRTQGQWQTLQTIEEHNRGAAAGPGPPPPSAAAAPHSAHPSAPAAPAYTTATATAPAAGAAPVAVAAPAAGGCTAEQQIRLMELQLAMKNADAVLLKEQNEKERLRQMQERGSAAAVPVPMVHEGVYPVGASSGKPGPPVETDSSAPKCSGKTARGVAKSSDLALAKRMRGYMLNLRKSLDLSVKAERGTAACAFKKCDNTYSGSTVFVPAVQKELRSRYPEYAVFAEKFFKSFPKSGRAVLVFKKLQESESSG